MATQNATLSYNGKTKNVIVTDYGYSWNLNMTARSYGKKTQTSYPRNYRKSDLTLGLAFTSMESYLDFGRWYEEYTLHLLSKSQPSHLVLSIPALNKVLTVILTSFPMKIAFDDVAYENTYTCIILSDDTESMTGGSDVTGDITDIPSNPVDVSQVTSSGDDAFK